MEGFSDGGFACGLAADGLPVVEPKRASVRAMLGDADPEASLGACPPANGACQLWRGAATVAAVRARLGHGTRAGGEENAKAEAGEASALLLSLIHI